MAGAIAACAQTGEIVPYPLNKNLRKPMARTALEQGFNRDDPRGYFD